MINIFVSNLSKHTTAEQLEQIFGQYGHVSEAKLIKDKKTGFSKRYGFIEMEDRDAGHAAVMNLEGAVLDGQNIAVKVAEVREKPQRRHNTRGGGGYNRNSRGGSYDNRRSSNSYNRDSSSRGNRDSRRPNSNNRDSSRPNFNRADSENGERNYNRNYNRDSYRDMY